MNVIDLSYRYRAAFGYLSEEALPKFVNLNNDFSFHSYERGDVEFEDITFRYDEKEVRFAAPQFISSLNNDVEVENILAPPPIINFSQEKEITTTPLRGDEVEVVEVWSTGAWDIRISGILIDMKNHNYPTYIIEKFRRMFQVNNVIECIGTQFYEKGIDHLYFKSVEINGVVGFEDTVQFTINARSIKDIGFKLSE